MLGIPRGFYRKSIFKKYFGVFQSKTVLDQFRRVPVSGQWSVVSGQWSVKDFKHILGGQLPTLQKNATNHP
jgi:hypothetical protein